MHFQAENAISRIKVEHYHWNGYPISIRTMNLYLSMGVGVRKRSKNPFWWLNIGWRPCRDVLWKVNKDINVSASPDGIDCKSKKMPMNAITSLKSILNWFLMYFNRFLSGVSAKATTQLPLVGRDSRSNKIIKNDSTMVSREIPETSENSAVFVRGQMWGVYFWTIDAK